MLTHVNKTGSIKCGYDDMMSEFTITIDVGDNIVQHGLKKKCLGQMFQRKHPLSRLSIRFRIVTPVFVTRDYIKYSCDYIERPRANLYHISQHQ